MENLATIKLTSGEELIAIVEEGPGPLELTLIDPVLVHKNNSMMGPMLSVSHWLMFTKENKAVIKKEKIVVLEYDLEDNTINHYKRFAKERGAVVSLDETKRLEDMIAQTLRRYQRTNPEEIDQIEEELEALESELKADANTTIH